jgi:hypothetical protein
VQIGETDWKTSFVRKAEQLEMNEKSNCGSR